MQHYQLSWEDALHMVQNRRYCISPNGGFLTQIKVRRRPFFTFSSIHPQADISQEYEAIYKASLAVASYPIVQRSVSRRKRSDDDDDDEDTRDDDRKRPLVKNDSEEFDPNAMETS